MAIAAYSMMKTLRWQPREMFPLFTYLSWWAEGFSVALGFGLFLIGFDYHAASLMFCRPHTGIVFHWGLHKHPKPGAFYFNHRHDWLYFHDHFTDDPIA